jgi:hypothetical protein
MFLISVFVSTGLPENGISDYYQINSSILASKKNNEDECFEGNG